MFVVSFGEVYHWPNIDECFLIRNKTVKIAKPQVFIIGVIMEQTSCLNLPEEKHDKQSHK